MHKCTIRMYVSVEIVLRLGDCYVSRQKPDIYIYIACLQLSDCLQVIFTIYRILDQSSLGIQQL